MADRPTLWQFTSSHFNEKARWALDWKGLPYDQRSLLPGLHVARVMWLTGQKSVPVLVLDGRVVADSTHIIEALERHRPDPALYPADPAARERACALEEFFDEQLGPHVRRFVFHHILGDGDYMCALFSQDAAPLARRAYRAIFPAIRTIMKLDMGIDGPRAEASRARVEASFDRLEREIGPSGYLVGDRFSVADLTAAALFAPLVQPREFPYAWPPPPEGALAMRAPYTTRAGFRWVEEMYRRHRVRPAAAAA